MAKDYYAILGVVPTATVDEIRSAYRSLAKQYHPDHFGRDSARFLSVQEAYEVLGDPESRRLYDHNLRDATARRMTPTWPEPEIIRSRKATAEPLRRCMEPMNLGTMSPLTSFRTYRPSFDEIFGEAWDSRYPLSRPKAERCRALTMEILLTQDQAHRGGRVQVLVPVETPCPRCGGLGETGFLQCRLCAGTGTGIGEFPLQVEFPPGIQDCYEVAIPLARFGLPDLCPILLFRVSTAGDFEDQ